MICELYTLIKLLLKNSLNLSVLRDEMPRQSQVNSFDPHCGVIMCSRPSFFSLFMFTFWRRKWQSTPVFLPGESHGWRTLVGCSPWGRKESDFCAKSRKKRLNSLTQFQLVTFEMLSHQVWPVAARLDLASVLVIA